MNGKQVTLGIQPSVHAARYSPPCSFRQAAAHDPRMRCPSNTGGFYGAPDDGKKLMSTGVFQGGFFGGLEDGLLARADAMPMELPRELPKHHGAQLMKPEGMYGHTPDLNGHHHNVGGSRPPPPTQMGMHPSHPGAFCPDSMLEQLTAANPPGMALGPVPTSMTDHHNNVASSHHGHSHHQMYPPMYSHPTTMNTHPGLAGPHHPPMHHPAVHDSECDPRELEAFAERFKQRRIKLGVTQADVGAALANLKIPGVGCLSQSTICRFESLTLSHNNMIALKPILQAWLDEAEKQAREKKEGEGAGMAEKKRKRTSIAAPEKRSLEAYFAVQPRPSGEKIAQIAEKLDLKKNVVRVWFCNQRQKQKRMKFSASMNALGHH